jgi:hypothetical protein
MVSALNVTVDPKRTTIDTNAHSKWEQRYIRPKIRALTLLKTFFRHLSLLLEQTLLI